MNDTINIYKAELIQLNAANRFSYHWRDLFYTHTFYWIDGRFAAIVDYENKETDQGCYEIPKIVMVPIGRIKRAVVVDVMAISKRDLPQWLKAQVNFLSYDPYEPSRIAPGSWYDDLRKVDWL